MQMDEQPIPHVRLCHIRDTLRVVFNKHQRVDEDTLCRKLLRWPVHEIIRDANPAYIHALKAAEAMLVRTFPFPDSSPIRAAQDLATRLWADRFSTVAGLERLGYVVEDGRIEQYIEMPDAPHDVLLQLPAFRIGDAGAELKSRRIKPGRRVVKAA